MKRNLLIISFLCLTKILYAQDSMRITTEVDTFAPPQYVSDYDNFFLKKEPRKSMWKLSTNSLIRDYGFLSNGYTLVPEFRISKGISLNIGASIQSYSFIGVKIEKIPNENSPFRIYIEPRYYYNKRREIAKEESANNLIGPYSGIRTGLAVGPYFKGTNYTTEAIFGLQQLFYYKGTSYKSFIDLNVGLGASFNKYVGWKPSYHFQVLFGGLLEDFGKILKDKKAPPAMCDIYQCFIEEQRMFKVDLLNLINVSNAENLDGGLEVNYEEKIKKSSFSINMGLAAQGYNFKINTNENKKIVGYLFKGYIEPRWYYRMKKNIAEGKSANNLSGVFWALQMGYQNTIKNNYENTLPVEVIKYNYACAYLIWGRQERFLKHFFLEVKLGLGVKSKKNPTYILLKNSHVGAVTDIKLGLAF
jgi:hypothetical protein